MKFKDKDYLIAASILNFLGLSGSIVALILCFKVENKTKGLLALKIISTVLIVIYTFVIISSYVIYSNI